MNTLGPRPAYAHLHFSDLSQQFAVFLFRRLVSLLPNIVAHAAPDVLDDQILTITSSSSPEPIVDNQPIGDSISSISTDYSANPQLSWSRSIGSSNVDNEGMTTPATSYPILSVTLSSSCSISFDLLGLTSVDEEEKESSHVTMFGMHHSHVPNQRQHPLHLITSRISPLPTPPPPIRSPIPHSLTSF